jgi:hypothetical protein
MKTFNDLIPRNQDRLREILEGYYGQMGTLSDWPISTFNNLIEGIVYDSRREECYTLMRFKSPKA